MGGRRGTGGRRSTGGRPGTGGRRDIRKDICWDFRLDIRRDFPADFRAGCPRGTVDRGHREMKVGIGLQQRIKFYDDFDFRYV